MKLEPQTISLISLSEKYAKGIETTLSDVRKRVAKALSINEHERENEFFQVQETGGFVTAGRIASAAGTDIDATLINCFVQPIGDSATKDVDGLPSIYTALGQAAETMRRGGGVGYDYSKIRPAGAVVKGTKSRASGPISFMRVFDKSCETVESAGARRGAQMGVIRCDHPDIEMFIHAKDNGELSNFNLSIGVTNEFMLAIEDNSTFELVHKAEPSVISEDTYLRNDGMWVYRKVNARELWKQVMSSTYDHAEPGILFLDQLNKENNLWYCEVIECTNPCGEVPIPSYGCCCLGSLNLTEFVRKPFEDNVSFDWNAFAISVKTAIRMLDNVLDVTFWPLEQQKFEAANKRRIGLGFLGLGDALVMMKIKYNSKEGIEFASKLSEYMRDHAYIASIELAKEKGAFPLFDAEKYLNGQFIKRLPEQIRLDIAKYGIRNSHLLSIAPTGTISLAFADNASNGIEPAFSWTYNRKKREMDNSTQVYEVIDHAYRLYRELGNDVSKLPDYFVSALDMSALDHIQMLEAVQPFIDAAISKTVNVPIDYPYDDFKNLYMTAWKSGLKGLATYRPNSTLGSVLSVKNDTSPSEKKEAKAKNLNEDNPLIKRINGRREGRMTAINEKAVLRGAKGKYSFYSSVSFDTVTGVLDGEVVSIKRPIETFFPTNQVSEGQQWITFVMMAISELLRSGGDIAHLLQIARGIKDDQQIMCGFYEKEDGSKIPMRHDSEAAVLAYILQRMLIDEGFLDSIGNQVPVKALVAKYKREEGEVNGDSDFSESTLTSFNPLVGNGKKCPECGANAMHRRDGCFSCEACNFIGTCG